MNEGPFTIHVIIKTRVRHCDILDILITLFSFESHFEFEPILMDRDLLIELDDTNFGGIEPTV